MPEQSVQYLKGVGPRRAEMFSKMGVNTLRDLASFFPRGYEDRRSCGKIITLQNSEKAIICGKVEVSEALKAGPSLSIFKAAINDGTGIAYALFFRKSSRYQKHDAFAGLKKDFEKGKYIFVSGAAEIGHGQKQIRAEEYEPYDPGAMKKPVHFNRVVPVYPLTEGISQKWLRGLISSNIEKFVSEWQESIPETILNREKLLREKNALAQIHFPDSPESAELARKTLAFSEFLLMETALHLVRQKTRRENKAVSYEIKKTLLTPFKEKLGFEFTSAQKKVINEIFSDMRGGLPMNRLLMGDVGSGKTVVALSAMLLAAENGLQSALLAPTEILAEQHFMKFEKLLKGLDVRLALVTGKLSSGRKTKKETHELISAGRADIVIGTHALLEKSVQFKKLSLVVVDEQHRFGVMQRAGLTQKAEKPDVLVMTATPIPRSLALTLYGDLDVSTIDSLPPGRIPVSTLHLSRDKAYSLIKQEVRNGRQAYIVYPLVEESDKIELKAAVKEANELSSSEFKNYRVGLLHGQMSSAEKEKVMSLFCDRKIDIEVGIDVANATVMVIEHAERFGLATLHQLRGRIGRGREKSYCVLLANLKTEQARKRIEIMLSTNDGFKVAQEDLRLRGPGEFFGTVQHGLPLFKAGDIIRDTALIESARRHAREILHNDSGLALPENSMLKKGLELAYKGRMSLSKIG